MKTRRAPGAWLLAGALLAAGPVAALAQDKVDLREYYPLQDGDSWTYQFRTHQADGQTNYSIKTYSVHGEEELKNGVKAKKLTARKEPLEA